MVGNIWCVGEESMIDNVVNESMEENREMMIKFNDIIINFIKYIR